MKMMTSRATTQRVSTSMRMCTSMLLSTVVAAVGSGESGMGRSEGLCLHMGQSRRLVSFLQCKASRYLDLDLD